MKMFRLMLVLLFLVSAFSINVAQEVTPEATPMEQLDPDQETRDYVTESLVSNFWYVASLLIVAVTGYGIAKVTNANQVPTLMDISKHALTFADLLGYLERLDLTDDRMDAVLSELQAGIRKEAARMGSSPEVILVKESKG